MNTRDYYEFLKCFMDRYCLHEQDIIFVENIVDWCRQLGITEYGEEKPLKLVLKKGNGCMMLVKEFIPDMVVNERLNALSIRSQLKNVAFDRSELLNSDKKKLAYLFLSELANSFPEIQNEWHADDWVFEEMEKTGFFQKLA